MAKEKTNFSLVMIAIVAIVAIVAMISLSVTLREAKAEETVLVVDEEGNIIGEAKGEKPMQAMKECNSFCRSFDDPHGCANCCLSFGVSGEIVERICYGTQTNQGKKPN